MRGAGGEGRRREKERGGGGDGDGVLPGGRDEAMSAPQKQAGSWRPPQARVHKENMGAFRCVSNTKQQVLCSLLRSLRRHAFAAPRTVCVQNSNQTAQLLF